ncbi:hypothetical protein Gogos_004666 [Gossypium gossypioides]|uniref:DUF4283 domain-containing protein n=1 Tax=Gossypium gossypioides TaxID=34282 RepID=A0A7J9CGY5_GOSGO|nr:hypothetical protein [Gossypium gossypioides]
MLEDSDLSSNGSDSPTKVSWKQMLLGQGDYNQEERLCSASNDSAENFDFLEGDVKKTMVNGIPAIEFSERIQQILFKDMKTTLCIKDYNKALSQGSWIIHGQYLIVQPWTKFFNPKKPYPSMVLAWIRLPELPGIMYKRRILEEVGGLVGKVVKLDLNTNSKTRSRFARMAEWTLINL